MKLFRRTLAISLILAQIFVLTGCWNYHEVEGLAIVGGVAVDKGENGYKYHLTFECAQMEGDQKSGGIKPVLMDSDGDSIFDAVRSTLQESDKKLYFSHCKIVVISSDLALEGILPILDWFERDAEPRVTLQFVVSKGKTAAEILKEKPQTNQLTSFQISGALGEATSFSAATNQVRLFEVNNVLNSQGGISLTLPGIETKGSGEKGTVQFSGNAVFSGDRLVGWLDKEESRYLMFVLGKVQGGLLLTGVHPDDSNVTLEILSSKTAVKPVVTGDKITMKIDVNLCAAYGEQNTRENLLDLYPLKTIEASADQTLSNGIENVIKMVQREYSADIFGFGNRIYEDDPGAWRKLRTDWNKTFKSVKCVVSAHVKIENTAGIFGRKGTE